MVAPRTSRDDDVSEGPQEIVSFQNKPRVGLVKFISFIAEFENKNKCFI